MSGKLSLLGGAKFGQSSASVPVNITPPSITGTYQVGSVLGGDNGSWSGFPFAYSYKWQTSANGSTGWTDIPGATASTFTLTASEAGLYPRRLVQATNSVGSSATYAPSASGGLVVPAGDNPVATVGAAWIASATGGGGDGWDGQEPDPAAYITARMAAGAKPQPGINFMGIRSVFFTDTHIWLPFQIKLQDSRIGSATHGRPVPCKLKWYVPGNTGFVSDDTQKIYLDAMGRAREQTARWVQLMRPPAHLGPGGAGQRGGEIRVYAEAIPDDLVNYAPRLIGPISIFPRDASGVIVKKIHKTAQPGVDYTSILAFWNAATVEFGSSGKFMVGEVVDSGKNWALGLKAPSDVIPCKTNVRLGLDLTTGLPSTGTIGDKTAFPSSGVSGVGVNRYMFEGFTIDQGGTGGIGPRDYGVGTIDEMALLGCDMMCSSFPASTGTYPQYGSGTGQSALVRGRQPGGAVITGGAYATDPNYYESVDTNWHDLPAMGLNRFAVIVNPVITNISGSPIQDTYGGVYGVRCSRFGGYYSGLATRPGDSNLAMHIDKVAGVTEYWGFRKPLGLGDPSGTLQFYSGATEPTATLVTSIPVGQYVKVSDTVAAINANPLLTGKVVATDLLCPVKLDSSFLFVEGPPTTVPLPLTEIPAAGGIDMIVTMDIHASGFAFTVGKLQYRMNITIENSYWYGYCGAASTSGSTADNVTDPNEITYWDIYFGHCGWNDERGYYDRQGNWQDMGIELGYLSGSKSGFGIYASTFTAAPGNGALSGPGSSGAAFGAAPFRKMEHCVVGFTYGQFGNYPVGFSMIGVVSPYQSLPSGPTPPINSKFIGTIGVTKPASEVFDAPLTAVWTLLPTTFAQTPDGNGWAGIFDINDQPQGDL